MEGVRRASLEIPSPQGKLIDTDHNLGMVATYWTWEGESGDGLVAQGPESQGKRTVDRNPRDPETTEAN